MIFIGILVYIYASYKFPEIRKYAIALCFVLLFLMLFFLFINEFVAAEALSSFIIFLVSLVVADLLIEELSNA